MKKTLTLACLASLLLPFGALAQYRSGMVSLGGSLRYDTYNSGSDDVAATSVSPTAAFSVTDNAMLGLSGTVYRYNSSSSFGFDSQDYSLSPFWRYNFPMAERGGLYGQVSPTVVFSSDQFYDSHSWGAGVGVSFGAYYFLTNHISLEAVLGSAQELAVAEFTEGSPMTWDNRLNFFITNGLGLSFFFVF